jgi:hypothetical protein
VKPNDLLDFLAKDGVTRAFAFCLDEPDRHPAFRAANDRTLAFARVGFWPSSTAVVTISGSAPGSALFLPRAQRSQPARVKRTRRRTSRREEFLCGIAFAPVFGRRGRHFGADHIANSPFPQTDVTQRSGDSNAGHPPTGGLRVESPPTGGLGFESLRRGILGGPDLDDARSSLSESLRGGAVTPKGMFWEVVTA